MNRRMLIWRTVEPPPMRIVLPKAAMRRFRPLRQPKKLVRLVPELLRAAVGAVDRGSVFVGTRFFSITPKGT